jgi:hypothetical protein
VLVAANTGLVGRQGGLPAINFARVSVPPLVAAFSAADSGDIDISESAVVGQNSMRLNHLPPVNTQKIEVRVKHTTQTTNG